MRLDLKSWWNTIYDKWLIEGELSLLLYLQKIERYLGKGSIKSNQETINLIAQIESLMNLKYHGQYKFLETKKSDVMIVKKIMNENIRLPENNLKSLTYFFENKSENRIKPQNTSLTTHPCWILWCSLYDTNYKKEIWAYRKMFLHYMNNMEYTKAAKVYQHACKIKVRSSNLPLLHPYIIKSVMYSNIKNNIEV